MIINDYLIGLLIVLYLTWLATSIPLAINHRLTSNRKLSAWSIVWCLPWLVVIFLADVIEDLFTKRR